MSASKPKTIRGSSKKIKSCLIIVENFKFDNADGKYCLLEKFLTSISADDQLSVLKSIIEEFKKAHDEKVAEFLALVFYEAPAKHPLKSFLSRHILKCTSAQATLFSNCLTTLISTKIRDAKLFQYNYTFYKENVPKIMMCVENFPPGSQAVDRMDFKFLADFLFVAYFNNTRQEHSNCWNYVRDRTLSPTEKNEQFSLEHVMLRLMVYLLQNMDDDGDKYTTCFHNMVECAKILILDEEVPMDTKSLAGILVLLIETKNTRLGDPFDNIVSGFYRYNGTKELREHRVGRLVLECAAAHTWPGHSRATQLVDKLLPFADGSAESAAATVCVARALVQLSRGAAGGRGASLARRALPFVWPHLDHPLDTVRHLASQLLANCLAICATKADDRVVEHRAAEDGSSQLLITVPNEDEEEALDALLSSMRSLGETRSFYWGVSKAVSALGAARTSRLLATPQRLLAAAATQDLHAAASAAISAMLAGGICSGWSPRAVFETWVRPALACPSVLHAVLPRAVLACPSLPRYIASVVSGRAALACARASPECRAPLDARTLLAVAVHHDDETRLSAMSLVCDSVRSTEVSPPEHLAAVLWLLRYNLAEPRAAFRTQLLHHVDKLLKRLTDSGRAAQKAGRSAECAHYAGFLVRLRRLALAGAGRGAGPARRAAALRLLAALHHTAPEHSCWPEEQTTTLLHHLDDSYDCNRELALSVLQHGPLSQLQDRPELRLPAVLAQARGLRAAHGAAASAKLRLLVARLPHTLPPARGADHMDVEERALYSCAYALESQLWQQTGLDLREEAARGGLAGTLRCLHDLLQLAKDRGAAWTFSPWSGLLVRLLQRVVDACACAEPVVCSAAPEGFLPACSYCLETPCALYCSESDKDTAKVTAQMVLVCAWRTIKEGAGVVAVLSGPKPCFTGWQAGSYLAGLAARAQHRGAADMAADALHRLALQLWREGESASLPQRWLADLMGVVSGGAPHATRRGAGLPAAIQALVSSEVVATGRTKFFDDCMRKLLKLAATDAAANPSDGAPAPTNEDGLPADVARRTLAANILRALFRHSALERASQAYVSEGLKLALTGFGAAAWPERTAMSLLFCALVVRVFGVQRARGALHARNTMPAGLFYSRHPHLYDTMLSKLEEFEPCVQAGPGVLPVLLVLGRLHPASEAATTLKVSRFVPLVLRCACACELRVRRLAARALPALLPQQQHVPYMEKLLLAASKPDLVRNHWHGALLTIAAILERVPCSDEPTDTQEGHNTLHVSYDILYGSTTTQEVPSHTLNRSTEGPNESCNSQDKSNAQNVSNSDLNTESGSNNDLNTESETNHDLNTEVMSNNDNNKKESEGIKDSKTDPGSNKNAQIVTGSNNVFRTKSRSNNDPKRVNNARSKVTLLPKGEQRSLVADSLCALVQATSERPCYVIAREYANVLNLLVWKYPAMVGSETACEALLLLDKIVFEGRVWGPDRALCLADCLLLYIVLLIRVGREGAIMSLVVRALTHKTYEVVLSAIDFLLSLHTALDHPDDCHFRQHLTAITDISLLENFRTTEQYDQYLNVLKSILFDTRFYQEGRVKSLRLITLEENTQTLLIDSEIPTYVDRGDFWVIGKLLRLTTDCAEQTKHMYLESLLRFVKGHLVDLNTCLALDVLGVTNMCCSARNSVECRSAVLEYLESDVEMVFGIIPTLEPPSSKFKYCCWAVSTLVTLLEDDDDDVRRRAADVIARLACDVTTHTPDPLPSDPYAVIDSMAALKQAVVDNGWRVVPPAAADLLREYVASLEDGCALLLLLALHHFQVEVCLTDERDEGRVFDQSERYNVLLEESVWTSACADRLIHAWQEEADLIKHALNVIQDRKYIYTFKDLCKQNLVIFEKMAKGETVVKDESLNPKIEILVDKLRLRK